MQIRAGFPVKLGIVDNLVTQLLCTYAAIFNLKIIVKLRFEAEKSSIPYH